MKRSQILLLAVAVVAGGLAGFLVLRGGNSRPAPVIKQVTQVAPQTKTKVLVAARDIGVGERLSAKSVAWQDWPDSAVRPEYIPNETTPDAPDAMNGSVARFEIFEGEPIREAKLVTTDQGYLSAVLAPGMRGVSISVTPESGSGGFITPNDHVDVVSTHSSSGGEISETVLANVKVLAIGKSLGGSKSGGNSDDAESGSSSKGFSRSTIATLELDPAQAETLLAAANSGSLSLVLRSVADFAQSQDDANQRRNQVNVIRYGRQVSVMAGAAANAGSSDPASVNPAAYEPPPPAADTSAPETPDVELQ
jgi:pilus assembly protein CpaB